MGEQNWPYSAECLRHNEGDRWSLFAFRGFEVMRMKLTPALAGVLCDARSQGMGIEEIASTVKVPRQYIWLWRKKAKTGKTLYVEFARMWSEAEKQSEQAVADALRKVYA